MTPATPKAKMVTLTRDQIASILIDHMGWEHEDVTVFWRAAQRECHQPGCIARDVRKYWHRVQVREGKA